MTCNRVEVIIIKLKKQAQQTMSRWRKPMQSNVDETKVDALLGCNKLQFQSMIAVKLSDWNERNPGHVITITNCHFDHIAPLSLAKKVGEELKITAHVRLLHWSNVQPMPEPFNSAKSNHWSLDDHKFWEKNIHNKRYTSIYWPIAMNFLQSISTVERPVKAICQSSFQKESIETPFLYEGKNDTRHELTGMHNLNCCETFMQKLFHFF